MKQLMFVVLSFVLLLSSTSSTANVLLPKKKKTAKIQVALLLDTSGSMDGLIEQAKSQLWKMVNELATSKKYGKSPDIEIALFHYGNDGVSEGEGHIEMISALTTDLDLISEKLFELSTNGGSEYCGWAIEDATKDLAWSKSKDDLKLIIIAGNEPFTQGKVDYKISCKNAIKEGIMVNTIHCGNYDLGVKTMWKDGADLADGKYMNIDHNSKIVHIESPYDGKILELNKKLNDTYIGYGRVGANRKMRQSVQDANATSYGSANMVERTLSKSSSAYKNDDWDLVDAMEKDEKAIEKLKKEDLPKEMQKMSTKERKVYIEKKKAERTAIQKEIGQLNKKRQEYVEVERSKSKEALTLDTVMLKAIREQAMAKGFEFKD